VESGEPIRRTSEIEETINLYFIHPIAGRLTPLFAAMHIPPNAVSLCGMAFGISAGAAYYHYEDLRWTIAGFVLMIAWHVMDGADGQLARLTHSQSAFGKILDGICDYVTFIAVYAALAAALSWRSGGWVWALVIVAGVCHAVQAAAYELQRQAYNFWGRGQKSAEIPEWSAAPRRRLSDQLYRLYLRVQLGLAGLPTEFREKLTAALESEPERAASIRRRYRAVFAPAVRRWSVMSANYHTLGIFIGALLNVPQYYFWFDIVGFSAILVALLSRQQARYRQFFNGLDSVARTAGGAIGSRGEKGRPPKPSTAAEVQMR
jgi:CDP-alcohol phosphatidyltransferase